MQGTTGSEMHMDVDGMTVTVIRPEAEEGREISRGTIYIG